MLAKIVAKNLKTKKEALEFIKANKGSKKGKYVVYFNSLHLTYDVGYFAPKSN